MKVFNPLKVIAMVQQVMIQLTKACEEEEEEEKN